MKRWKCPNCRDRGVAAIVCSVSFGQASTRDGPDRSYAEDSAEDNLNFARKDFGAPSPGAGSGCIFFALVIDWTARGIVP